MLLTLYKFELKKLFCAKVNVIAMTGSVIMLIFLAVSSISEAVPVSPEAAEELNGRVIDGQMIDELAPAVRYENDREGVNLNYEVLSDVISYARSAGSPEELSKGLNDAKVLGRIREDYKKRHKK